MSTDLAIVLPSFAGGGAERAMLTLAKHLTLDGVSICLVILDASGPLKDAVPQGLSVQNLGHARLRTSLPALLFTLREIAPRAVLSTIGYVNLAIAALRPVLRSQTRIILREANLPSLSLRSGLSAPLFRAAYRLLYPRADIILCTSRMMEMEFRQDYRVPASSLVVIANPVDVSFIRGRAATPRRQPGSGRHFVSAGRLVPQKGFGRLIDLMAFLPLDSTLTILGDGPDRLKLQVHIDALGLSNRVKIAGFIADPWPYYAGADAVVLASLWEGMPNVALEALACGTPVIATPTTGGLVEISAETLAGALRIEPFGVDFRNAMTSVVGRFAPVLRPSLLPDRFLAERVAHDVTSLLGRIAA